MSHIEGKDRHQIELFTLDDAVDKEHIVRVIDKFADILDYEELGFGKVGHENIGRPSYNPSHMVKLYIYGYETGTRSSRKLEQLAKESLPAMWLMESLTPDFKTIADFRKDNKEALTKLFDEYNKFADYCGLYGKEIVALDGTKIKASSSKKRNYTKKKIEKNIEYSKTKAKEYLEALAATDDMDEAFEFAEKAKTYEKSAADHVAMLKLLESSGEGEISTTDPDAHLMSNGKGGVDVSYNVQAVVDAKNHLVAEMDVVQSPNDHGQLGRMTEKTQETFRKKSITVLADKGYYGREDYEFCEGLGATAIVAKQKEPSEKKCNKYSIDKFQYDKETDIYTCPEGQHLEAHSAPVTKRRRFFNKLACSECPSRGKCIGSDKKFREVNRHPYRDTLDRLDKTYRENPDKYKLRQETVEHVFGTVKRAMDGSYFLLRSNEKVRAEAALLFLGYNIKRTKAILGTEKMMELIVAYSGLLSSRVAGQFLLHTYFSRHILFLKHFRTKCCVCCFHTA
jgi:transposase